MLDSEFHLRSKTNVNNLDLCFVKLKNSLTEITNIPNKSNKSRKQRKLKSQIIKSMTLGSIIAKLNIIFVKQQEANNLFMNKKYSIHSSP